MHDLELGELTLPPQPLLHSTPGLIFKSCFLHATLRSKPFRSLSCLQVRDSTSSPGTQCSPESSLGLLSAASPLPGPWLCCPPHPSSIHSRCALSVPLHMLRKLPLENYNSNATFSAISPYPPFPSPSAVSLSCGNYPYDVF